MELAPSPPSRPLPPWLDRFGIRGAADWRAIWWTCCAIAARRRATLSVPRAPPFAPTFPSPRSPGCTRPTASSDLLLRPHGRGTSYEVTVTRRRMRDWRGGRLSYDEHDGTDFVCPPGSPLCAAPRRGGGRPRLRAARRPHPLHRQRSRRRNPVLAPQPRSGQPRDPGPARRGRRAVRAIEPGHDRVLPAGPPARPLHGLGPRAAHRSVRRRGRGSRGGDLGARRPAAHRRRALGRGSPSAVRRRRARRCRRHRPRPRRMPRSRAARDGRTGILAGRPRRPARGQPAPRSALLDGRGAETCLVSDRSQPRPLTLPLDLRMYAAAAPTLLDAALSPGLRAPGFRLLRWKQGLPFGFEPRGWRLRSETARQSARGRIRRGTSGETARKAGRAANALCAAGARRRPCPAIAADLEGCGDALDAADSVDTPPDVSGHRGGRSRREATDVEDDATARSRTRRRLASSRRPNARRRPATRRRSPPRASAARSATRTRALGDQPVSACIGAVRVCPLAPTGSPSACRRAVRQPRHALPPTRAAEPFCRFRALCEDRSRATTSACIPPRCRGRPAVAAARSPLTEDLRIEADDGAALVPPAARWPCSRSACRTTWRSRASRWRRTSPASSIRRTALALWAVTPGNAEIIERR